MALSAGTKAFSSLSIPGADKYGADPRFLDRGIVVLVPTERFSSLDLACSCCVRKTRFTV
jgi:hypothetical protein